MGESSGAHIFNTTAAMPSGTLDVEMSRLLIIRRTCVAEMERGKKVDAFRRGKVGSGRSPSASEEFLAN